MGVASWLENVEPRGVDVLTMWNLSAGSGPPLEAQDSATWLGGGIKVSVIWI